MKLKMMYSFLNSDIEKIERALEETVQANSSILHESSLHLLQAGGKRIRPIFVLLAGQFGNYDIQKELFLDIGCRDGSVNDRPVDGGIFW